MKSIFLKQYSKIKFDTVSLCDIVILTKVKDEKRPGGGYPYRVFYMGDDEMARRPDVPCKHPGCARLVPYGQSYCDEHKPEHKRDRDYSCDRGYGFKWQRARKKFLMAHPVCVRCLEEGKITEATVVDHIIPHRGDMKLFWDQSNWQPLCEHHHNVKTKTEDLYEEYHF